MRTLPCLAAVCVMGCNPTPYRSRQTPASAGPIAPATLPAQRCGNGRVEPPEQCDGPEVPGPDCFAQGYYRGQRSCGPDCRIEPAEDACRGRCGDGIVDWEDGEVCDVDAPESVEPCDSAGLREGERRCAMDCRAIVENCRSRCGDGVREPTHGEECDGADVGEAGICDDGRSLDCDGTCHLFGSCDALCGDGVCAADNGEDCATCWADCGCADWEACDADARCRCAVDPGMVVLCNGSQATMSIRFDCASCADPACAGLEAGPDATTWLGLAADATSWTVCGPEAGCERRQGSLSAEACAPVALIEPPDADVACLERLLDGLLAEGRWPPDGRHRVGSLGTLPASDPEICP